MYDLCHMASQRKQNQDPSGKPAGNPVGYMERTRLYYEAQGFTKPYTWAHYDTVPFTQPSKPLAESTVAIVTTAALYDRDRTDVREVASGSTTEPPQMLFGNDLSWDKEATHLDDLNAFFPLETLQSLAAEGRINGVAERFHCAPTEYSTRRTIESDAPELLRRCREDGADIALLIPI